MSGVAGRETKQIRVDSRMIAFLNAIHEDPMRETPKYGYFSDLVNALLEEHIRVQYGRSIDSLPQPNKGT